MIQMRFFMIPVRFPEHPTRELNEFLATHRVDSLEREFVADGSGSYWAIAATYSCQAGDDQENDEWEEVRDEEADEEEQEQEFEWSNDEGGGCSGGDRPVAKPSPPVKHDTGFKKDS